MFLFLGGGGDLGLLPQYFVNDFFLAILFVFCLFIASFLYIFAVFYVVFVSVCWLYSRHLCG